MWREGSFLSEKFSMLQSLDIPEGPTRVHRIRNCLQSKTTSMPSLVVFVRDNFRWKLMGFITGDGLCKDWEPWAFQVWNEDGFQVVNVRNDQYLFKSVGFDEALRLLPVSAILFGASGCAAALSNFQWKDRRELWPKAVPKTRDQLCSRICVLKNCSNFLEMT